MQLEKVCRRHIRLCMTYIRGFRMLSKVVLGWVRCSIWVCLEHPSVKMGRFHKITLIRENEHFGHENDKSAMNRNISSLSIYMCVSLMSGYEINFY